MRKFFGLDNSMFLAEKVARVTISLSLFIMMLAPLPIIFIAGAGPFAFVYPLLILPGFYTLRGTCVKYNWFHYIFLALYTIATMSIMINRMIAIILPIFLFCFLLYFQAEKRLYYLLALYKADNNINDSAQDQKNFCKIYFLNCCKNAVLPAVLGSIMGLIITESQVYAWGVSGICLILCCGIYAVIRKRSY